MARERAATSAALAALADATRDAVELAASAMPLIDELGGAGDLAPLCAQLRAQLGADDVVVALAGARRLDAVAALVGDAVSVPEPAPGVRLRLLGGDEIGFEARWPDGRREGPPPDRRDELAAALSLIERAVDDEEERVRALSAELLATTQAAAAAQDEVVRAEAEPRIAAPPRLVPAAKTPTPRPRRSPLVALWLWLVTLLRSFFGRAAPALPPADDLAAVAARAADEARARARRLSAVTSTRDSHVHAVAARQRALDTARARLAKVAAERDQRRRALQDDRDAERRRILGRLSTLLTRPGAASLEVDVVAPAVPPGVIVLLRSDDALWREPVDATLVVDDVPARDALAAELSRIRARRPTELARRVAALVCSCRNRIVDVTDRARRANEERLGELVARRIAAPDAFRQQARAAAHLPLARGAEQIVDEAATQLERLVDEARQAWEQRIDSCAGIEQLRAEVAAIENGAAHRLSLVCDELRETMTLQFVRLVLEQSRPVRQELLRKRLEVARGRSPKAEETFEDIRVVFPGEVDKALSPLRTPGIGELLSTERSLFDPLFRTLAREKRECVSRLRARVDDVARTTARELYASTVFISPLLQTTFGRLVDELLTAHERWIEAREAEERRAWDEQRARHKPALDLVDPLADREQGLARLLESAGAREG